ncbi:FtsW/RodA/SpoVE family cell cycle protein, partial [Bacillus thuringiensis]
MKKILKLDYLLLLPLFITCTLGIIMMYSASSIVAVQHYGYNSRHFVDSQLTKLLLGTIGLIICALLPYEIWKKRIVSICIMVGGIFLLIMVLWKGKVVNNAQSWIFGIQP